MNCVNDPPPPGYRYDCLARYRSNARLCPYFASRDAMNREPVETLVSFGVRPSL